MEINVVYPDVSDPAEEPSDPMLKWRKNRENDFFKHRLIFSEGNLEGDQDQMKKD
jgi:hypothetical protein